MPPVLIREMDEMSLRGGSGVDSGVGSASSQQHPAMTKSATGTVSIYYGSLWIGYGS